VVGRWGVVAGVKCRAWRPGRRRHSSEWARTCSAWVAPPCR
jgi:hypothetical protein